MSVLSLSGDRNALENHHHHQLLALPSLWRGLECEKPQEHRCSGLPPRPSLLARHSQNSVCDRGGLNESRWLPWAHFLHPAHRCPQTDTAAKPAFCITVDVTLNQACARCRDARSTAWLHCVEGWVVDGRPGWLSGAVGRPSKRASPFLQRWIHSVTEALWIAVGAAVVLLVGAALVFFTGPTFRHTRRQRRHLSDWTL